MSAVSLEPMVAPVAGTGALCRVRPYLISTVSGGALAVAVALDASGATWGASGAAGIGSAGRGSGGSGAAGRGRAAAPPGVARGAVARSAVARRPPSGVAPVLTAPDEGSAQGRPAAERDRPAAPAVAAGTRSKRGAARPPRPR